jgi:hypothetical protein
MCQALRLHVLRPLFFATLLTSHVHGRVPGYTTRLRCGQKSIKDDIGLCPKCWFRSNLNAQHVQGHVEA